MPFFTIPAVLILLFFTIPAVLPAHCVVDFTEEKKYSLVPVKKLSIPVESVAAGCECMVEWGQRKQLFKATVVGVGKFPS